MIMQTGCSGTRLSGGLGSVMFMVGPNDLKGFFQTKEFYDCTIQRQPKLKSIQRNKILIT